LDETLQSKLGELSKKIMEVSYRVETVIEAEVQKPPDVIAANKAVTAVAAEYTELLSLIPEEKRMEIERTYGRRVMDLRRQASKLPRLAYGQAVENAPDSTLGSGLMLSSDPSLTRSTTQPRTMLSDTRRGADLHRHTVGGDVEAWCGPCGGLRGHVIVALVSGEPKQVLCQSCGAKHGFRLTPARSKNSDKAKEGGKQIRGKMTREQATAKRKEGERLTLIKELTEAAEVRAFQKKERYKVGQIIEHVEYGRGKIENILKGSLLIRFRSGLKSLSTL
jgi:hypothetical protein